MYSLWGLQVPGAGLHVPGNIPLGCFQMDVILDNLSGREAVGRPVCGEADRCTPPLLVP